jgi:hypothetical protein
MNALNEALEKGNFKKRKEKKNRPALAPLFSIPCCTLKKKQSSSNHNFLSNVTF